jgi:hypothetical protein
VLGFAVHFDQLRLEVAADLLENGLEPLEGVSPSWQEPTEGILALAWNQ